MIQISCPFQYRLPFWLFVLVMGLATWAQSDDASNWPYKAALVPNAQSSQHEFVLQHNGLAQPDARDVRVFASDGQALSHFVSHAEPGWCRVVFAAKPNSAGYEVRWGNLSASLAPVPASGIVALGAAEWRPKGGFSATTYRLKQPLDKFKSTLMTGRDVVQFMTAAAAGAADTEPVETDNKDLKKANALPNVRQSVLPDSYTRLPENPGKAFVHHIRAVVQVPESQEWYFMVGDGDQWDHDLRMLFVNNDTGNPVVPGWYTVSYGTTVTVKGTGTRKMPAGRHVIELYTTRDVSAIRVRLGATGSLERLDGRLAHFDDSSPVTIGQFQTTNGQSLADAMEMSAQTWIANGQHSTARLVARAAKERFTGQVKVQQRFAAIEDSARQQGFDQYWLMESKYPNRSGAMPDAPFAPPLRLLSKFKPMSFHDPAAVSSSIWSENGHHHGLPQQLFRDNWAVTSGISMQDGVHYVGFRDGRMCALENSKLKWAFAGEGPCYGTPLVYRNTVYYGGLDRRLYALTTEHGRMIWNYPTHGWLEGSPAAADGTLFFGCRKGYVYGIDAALGVERWQRQVDGAVTGTPTVVGKRVFVGTHNRRFYALNAKTGAIVWQYEAKGAIQAGACAGRNAVYFGDAEGFVHGLKQADGKSIWRGPCKVTGPVACAPVLIGSVVYGGTANGEPFWGVDAESGLLGWTQKMPSGRQHRAPVFADNKLIFATSGRGFPTRYRQFPKDRQGAGVMLGMANGPKITAYRPKTLIQVDGKLNEADWLRAPKAPQFYKHNGMRIADPVTAKVLWDDQQLYFAVQCRTQPGTTIDAGDTVSIIFAPKGMRKAIYEFTVNAEGETRHRLHQSDSDDGPATWTAKTQRVSDGWIAELAIPTTTLPEQLFGQIKGGRSWTFNILFRDSSSAADNASATTWGLAPSMSTNDVGALTRWGTLALTADAVAQ